MPTNFRDALRAHANRSRSHLPFSAAQAVNDPEKSVFRRDAETSTPETCAALLQLAEPAQCDGSLGIVDFVAAMEGPDPDPLKSGAFD